MVSIQMSFIKVPWLFSFFFFKDLDSALYKKHNSVLKGKHVSKISCPFSRSMPHRWGGDEAPVFGFMAIWLWRL